MDKTNKKESEGERDRSDLAALKHMIIVMHTYFFLLLQLFHENVFLFVFTAFILKPNTNDTRTQPSHLHQLFLHQRIRTWIRIVASAQSGQLFVVQHGSNTSRFVFAVLVRIVMRRRSSAAAAATCPVR